MKKWETEKTYHVSSEMMIIATTFSVFSFDQIDPSIYPLQSKGKSLRNFIRKTTCQRSYFGLSNLYNLEIKKNGNEIRKLFFDFAKYGLINFHFKQRELNCFIFYNVQQTVIRRLFCQVQLFQVYYQSIYISKAFFSIKAN